jgi:hypothetical protein
MLFVLGKRGGGTDAAQVWWRSEADHPCLFQNDKVPERLICNKTNLSVTAFKGDGPLRKVGSANLPSHFDPF